VEKYHKHQLKPEMIDEFKFTLQTIWNKAATKHINTAVANFTKYLTACVAASGGHLEHLQ